MDVFAQIAKEIIDEQKTIIGPLAIEQAKQVSGLKIDDSGGSITITGDKTETIQGLVERYHQLFGQTSVEVCKEAARSLLAKLPAQQIPSSLR